MKLIISLLLCTLTLFQCAQDNSDDDKKRKLIIIGLLALAVQNQTPYIEITPSAGSITIPIRSTNSNFTRAFQPRCTGVPGNQVFKFYLKRGSSKNLLINFMGGGACWDGKNCFGTNTTTYFNSADLFNPLVVRTAFRGIMEERDARNPFQTWNVLLISYCSGDLHWGSNETTYLNPTTNTNTTLQHRGFDNFLSALDFVRRSSDFVPESNSRIFVTGQSAGAYGAIFNYPYIAEAFPNNEVHLLGDAGNGVFPVGFNESAVVGRWGAGRNLPTWVGHGVSESNFVNLSFGEFTRAVAQFYSNRRFAQYTTNYDATQRFFYEIQLKIQGGNSFFANPVTYSDSPSLWGNPNGTQVLDSVSCEWVTGSRRRIINEAGTASNYRYYISSGETHTISGSNAFFTENSGGQGLLDWYNQMLAGSAGWVNRDCRTIGNCSPPATSTSPNGLVCR